MVCNRRLSKLSQDAVLRRSRQEKARRKRKIVGWKFLSPDQRHHPARNEYAAHKQGETIQTVLHLLHRGIALRNAEDNRGE